MKPALLAALACLAPGAALAQSHDHHAGHAPAPAPPTEAADPHAHHHAPAAPQAADPHAGHKPSTPAAPDPHAHHRAPASPPAEDPHAGHVSGRGGEQRTGADLPVGSAPAPPAVTSHAADRVWSAGMDRARLILAEEHGGMRLFNARLELFELRPGEASDAYAWGGELRYGGDINRLVLSTEGDGELDHELEHAEIQALWSRAVTPYFDVQAGLRQDLQPLGRTYAALGFEGLAPYWVELQGALFLSHRGVVSARLEGSWDLRLTQRLILEPRAEINLATDDDKAAGLGSGFQDAEVGLRLRYEIRREFAPYIGVQYERSFGETADLGRDEGEDIEQTRLVVGVRAGF